MALAADGIAIRPMRLKILYTFDLEHKNNHLARYPHPLDIQTAFIDDSNQIGVVELKTCLDAVLEASPELHSNAETDFTIYAYDYSEPDTPLVGQGLLSRKIGVEMSDMDTENVVTGRVTKNVMGLFAKNAQETLEVKIRFNPVAPSNELRNQRQRSGSLSVGDTLQRTWSNTSLAQEQAIPPPASPMDTSGLEAMQRMLSERSQPRERSGSFSGSDPFHARPNSRPASRAGTPNPLQTVNPSTRQPSNSESRPNSRAEMRPAGYGGRDSLSSGYYSAEETIEDGRERKRAKITKIRYPSRSDLNIERQPDSLRVAASTASSVRIHRPVPLNPALALETNASTDQPIRPPTPVPSKTGRPRGRPPKKSASNLNRASVVRQSSTARDSAIGQSDHLDLPMSSPEDVRPRSASSTPANIPSSPPVIPEPGPLPSSPRLPPLLSDHDSGFMSSNFDDIFGEDGILHFDEFITEKSGQGSREEDQALPTRESTLAAADTYAPVFEEGNDVEGVSETNNHNLAATTQPTQIPNFQVPPPPPEISQTALPNGPPLVSSPKLAPAPYRRARQIEDERRASVLPQIPVIDLPPRVFHRSNTWAGDMSDILTSDAPTGEDQKTRAASRKRVGKEQTKARCDAAIASGEMPPFCDNCGAIETPAWRRAYRRDFDCPWEEVETSLERGGCYYKEPVEYKADGSIRTFKGYKLHMAAEDSDQEWKAISLCNPCGLWFNKQKCMRPPEKWNKKDPQERRRRRSRHQQSGPVTRQTSGSGPGKSDVPTPASDGSSPADTATEAADVDDRDRDDGPVDDNEPELPPLHRPVRANSAEPNVGRGRLGLDQAILNRRVTRSSPLKPVGSDNHPIEIDLTPKSVRRQLFPSPNKTNGKSDAMCQQISRAVPKVPTFLRRSPRLNKTKDLFGPSESMVSNTQNHPDNSTLDKPNEVFEHGEGDMGLPPRTPQRKRETEVIFKTPKRTPQRTFGNAVSPNVRRTPKSVSGQQTVASVLMGLNKTPAKMTPFTRSIHEALLDNPVEGGGSPIVQLKSPAQGPGRSPDKNVSAALDFPDLPSLNGSSPLSHSQTFNFDFSELTTDQLNTDYPDIFSTDAPMPSSPPTGFFNLDEASGLDLPDFWKDGNFFGDNLMEQIDPSPIKNTGEGQILRRSPRKKQTA